MCNLSLLWMEDGAFPPMHWICMQQACCRRSSIAGEMELEWKGANCRRCRQHFCSVKAKLVLELSCCADFWRTTRHNKCRCIVMAVVMPGIHLCPCLLTMSQLGRVTLTIEIWGDK
jgi:hypothetical protein